MKMMETNQVQYLINVLTLDEDYRQELWVYYLNGNSPNTFLSYLDKLNQTQKESELFNQALWQLTSSSSYSSILDIISDFSEFEKSLIVLMILGLTPSAIADYKSISEIRVQQAISVIRYNPFWESLKRE